MLIITELYSSMLFSPLVPGVLQQIAAVSECQQRHLRDCETRQKHGTEWVEGSEVEHY